MFGHAFSRLRSPDSDGTPPTYHDVRCPGQISNICRKPGEWVFPKSVLTSKCYALIVGCFWVAWAGGGIPIKAISAQDFKISSEIYNTESSLPVSSNITLFADDLVCDFLMSNEIKPQPLEIVIFDKTQKQLVLLDVERMVKVEISDLQIMKLLEVLTRETLQNETSAFLLKDEFKEDSEPDKELMTFTGSAIKYQVKGSFPKNPGVLPKYYEFLDNFTKLGATDPHKIPPFPRLKLNSALKRLGWFPTEVRVEISTNDFFRSPIEAYSKHHLTEGLSKKDREMIQTAKNYWIQFKMVDLPEYRRISSNRVERTSRKIAQRGDQE